MVSNINTSSPKGNDRSPNSKSSKYFEYSRIKYFLNWSRTAYSAVHGWSRPNFTLIWDYIVVLVTCKNEEDPIKNDGSRVRASLLFRFFRRSRAANSKVSCGIPPKFELIQALIVVLVTCKNEKDPIKNKGSRVLTRLYDVFPDTQGQLTQKSAAEFCPNPNSSKLL